MRQVKVNFSSLIFFIISVFQVQAHCTENKFFMNDNMKQKQQQESDVRYKKDISIKTDKFFNATTARIPHATVKKWHVGRVSRKQYEIVNMLWRKTNIFIDIDNTSQASQYDKIVTEVADAEQAYESRGYLQESLKVPPPRSFQYSSTPSYIEFYYLDETIERINHKDISNAGNQRKFTTQSDTKWSYSDLKVPDNKKIQKPNRNIGIFKVALSRSPFFAFHINNPAYIRPKHVSTSTVTSVTRNNRKNAQVYILPKLYNKGFVSAYLPTYTSPVREALSVKLNLNLLKSNTSSTKILLTENVLSTTQRHHEPHCDTKTQMSLTHKNNDKNETSFFKKLNSIESTTAYDKIKFFEIYDSLTRPPYGVNQKGSIVKDDNENADYGNEINSGKKILLEHVDHDMGHHDGNHKMRHEKKHIGNKARQEMDEFLKRNSTLVTSNFSVITENISSASTPTDSPIDAESHDFPKLMYTKILNTASSNLSRAVAWSEYPFSAVYVFERFQVHCDAAIISPHWLVASASCLSRYQEDSGRKGRSAFVTYCGDSWWNPERIAYVKSSFVHPRFNPKEWNRRHLYNIGLIQVVTSMESACTNWEPISIMSHQFTTDRDGSFASVIGWGLDRYDARYGSTDLPRKPLAVYKGLVYSDSCPGNVGYSKAKLMNEDDVKNVYCLALPAYLGEENDPAHGALLLVEGKLIALYLQEERRPWGEQSAQYTGIWRLAPWVLDVAREPEHADFDL